jgi:hypothetical protein
MKAHSVHNSRMDFVRNESATVETVPIKPWGNSIALERVPTLVNSLNTVLRVTVAFAPAAALVLLVAWLAESAALLPYLQVTAWAGGFVFLGLSLEARSLVTAASAVFSGLALFALAKLGAVVGSEFLVVAAALVSAWVAWALYRRK